jgi:prophage regulatory protein
MTDRFLRERELRAMTGLSRTTRWRLERAGQFPRKRRISPGAVGWLESEVVTWMEQGSDSARVAPGRPRLVA